MRVFILEDDFGRINWFHQNFDDFAHLDIHFDAREAIKHFGKQYDMIMLDHDLGGQVYVDVEEENTGSFFCKWLAKQPFDRETPINIHSHNPAGADYMKELLVDGGFKAVSKLNFGKLAKAWDQGILAINGHYKYDKD